jgi:hypothetical protein
MTMTQTAQLLRVIALVLVLGAFTAPAAFVLADDETPVPPGAETWPGKVVCGGEIDRPDEYCYTVPDIMCRSVDGVIEECVERKPQKPGEKPSEPEAPPPLG